jgi:hypothetical protein
MFIRNGIPFNVDAPFTGEDGTQYPAGHFRGADAETLQSVGVTEVVDPVFKDDRYYINSQAADGLVESVAKPLDGVIKTISAQINAKRDDMRFNGGVKVGANWFRSDAIATAEYNSLVLLSAGQADTVVLRAGWRTMDGTKVDMTPALVKQILMAGFAKVAAIDDASEGHKEALGAAVDVEEIAAYDWQAGWPEVFVPASLV